MKNRVGMVLITCAPLIIGLMLIVLLAPIVPPAFAAQPCCSITNIAGGLVTAKETATGKTFQFQVTDPALMKSLRVGQKVYADFGTQRVSVDGVQPCCSITSAAGAQLPTIQGA